MLSIRFLLILISRLVLSTAATDICQTTWKNISNSCQVQIDCVLSTFEEADKVFGFKQNVQVTCCNLEYLNIIVNLNFQSGLSISGDQNEGSLLILEPKECHRKINEVEIYYTGFSGIDVNFKSYSSNTDSVQHRFQFGHLRLTKAGKTSANCSNNYSLAIFNQQPSISSFLQLKNGMVYISRTCDRLFLNSRFELLQINGNIDSSIKHNLIGFEETMNAKQMNCRIKTFFIEGFGFKLDERSFPSNLFTNSTRIDVSGGLKGWDPEILKGKRLKSIHLRILRLKRFLHNNVKWLDFANQRKTSSTLTIHLSDPNPEFNSNISLITNLSVLEFFRIGNEHSTLYDAEPKDIDLFTPENFCLFYRIEQRSLNVRLSGFLFEQRAQVECGCTLFWILKKFYKDLNRKWAYYDSLDACENRWNELSRECDFDQMGARCLIETVQPINEPSMYQMVLGLKIAEYWADVLLGPGLSLLAVVVNALVVLVFRSIRRSDEYRKNKLKDKNRRMWDFVCLNSYFVLFQALVFALGPISSCIEYQGIFCSPWILTRFMQVFYLFVESYLENVLRLMANVTNTMFVLYRYAVNVDCWPKLRGWRPTRVLLVALLPCCLISLIKLQVNERFNVWALAKSPLEYLTSHSIDDFSHSQLLTAIYVMNALLRNVVFVFVNLIVDVRLLFHLRGHSEKVRKEEAESRITKMIVLNGLFSLFFRLPELASTFALLVYTFNVKLFPVCLLTDDPLHSVCPILFKLSKLFYTISLLEGFVLLILLNQQFRIIFISFFLKIKTLK
nr:G protein-coupled receptor [Proales similis]